MTANPPIVTGADYASGQAQPLAALAQFYAAFNRRDLALMARNWLATEASILDNPLGGMRRGWEEIRPLYERLFTGPARVYVEFYDYSLHAATDMFYAVGRERGWFRLGQEDIALAIRTSRVFCRVDGQWKQVHHHGSIDDPALLARYQSAVLSPR